MKKIFFYSLIIFSFISTSASAASSSEIALSLIQKYGFGRNLTSISYQTALQTQTYKMITKKLGNKKLSLLLKVKLANLFQTIKTSGIKT
jgi:hypothetical protein